MIRYRPGLRTSLRTLIAILIVSGAQILAIPGTRAEGSAPSLLDQYENSRGDLPTQELFPQSDFQPENLGSQPPSSELPSTGAPRELPQLTADQKKFQDAALAIAFGMGFGVDVAMDFSTRIASQMSGSDLKGPADPDQNKAFKDLLKRYTWAYQQFDQDALNGVVSSTLLFPDKKALKKAKKEAADAAPGLRQTAAGLAEHLAGLDDDSLKRYQKAYAYGASIMGTGNTSDIQKVNQTSVFADEFAHTPKEYFKQFQTAYGGLQASGIQLNSQQLQQFAETVANSPDPTSTLKLTQQILNLYPVQNGEQFLNALDYSARAAQSRAEEVQKSLDHIKTYQGEHPGDDNARRTAFSGIFERQIPRTSSYQAAPDYDVDRQSQISPEEVDRILNQSGVCPGNEGTNPLGSDTLGSLLGADDAAKLLGKDYDYDKKGAKAWMPSMRAAARAFQLPEKLLACTAEIESNFHGGETSGAGAGGMMQIMPGTCNAIRNTIMSGSRGGTSRNDTLRAEFETYVSTESQLQVPVASTSAGSCGPGHGLPFNTPWAVGASALLTRENAQSFFGVSDFSKLGADDLLMVMAAYNAGIGGLRKNGCVPGRIRECMGNMLHNPNHAYRETFCYMLKGNNCLHGQSATANLPGVCGGRGSSSLL